MAGPLGGRFRLAPPQRGSGGRTLPAATAQSKGDGALLLRSAGPAREAPRRRGRAACGRRRRS